MALRATDVVLAADFEARRSCHQEGQAFARHLLILHKRHTNLLGHVRVQA